MTIQHSSPGRTSTGGLADLPATGDPEGFSAHVMLAILSCHLRLAEEARLHLSQATSLLERSCGTTQTLRSAGTAMLVRVRTQTEGGYATLTLPCVGGKVITPRISLAAILPALRDGSLRNALVELCDLSIEVVRLRVRTGRTHTALKQLAGFEWLEDLAAGLDAVLEQCIVPSASAAPLDMADAYFTVAHHFTRTGNRALADLALQKARSQIELYAAATDVTSHRRRSDDVVTKIDRLVARKEGLLF